MKKVFATVFVTVVFIFLSSSASWARAGGAGGGHGGGGGGGRSSGGYGGGGYSGGYRSYGHTSTGVNYSNGNSMFPVFLFLIIILIVLYFIYRSNRARGFNSTSVSALPEKTFLKPEEILAFKRKVGVAFLGIQKSWSDQTVQLMRRFITDGVYQRFHAQFMMMKKLELTDEMTDVDIGNITIVNHRYDGIYEVADVQIQATATDQFVSHRYPFLNSPGGTESFTEYWSFVRRKDHTGKDIFNSENCPKCSAPLNSQLVETARCPYCGTYINNGEYDWVLAEITQENDYRAFDEAEDDSVTKTLSEKIPDYSKQLIEDRASNAFMQILIAMANKEVAPLVRFSTSEALQGFKHMMLSVDYIFDRLFLNSVDLIGQTITGDLVQVSLAIEYSFRRVQITGERVELLDDDVVVESKTMTMVRKLNDLAPKGSIYANSCSSCGAPQKDTLSSVCSFCGAPFNDSSREWIVSGLI